MITPIWSRAASLNLGQLAVTPVTLPRSFHYVLLLNGMPIADHVDPQVLILWAEREWAETDPDARLTRHRESTR